MVSRNLTFAPLQPSNLQYASGPASPASPISPFGLRPRPSSLTRARPISPATSKISSISFRSDSLPARPDAWKWKCHQCHSRFPLGATRRCLHDGHYLCSGSREVSRRTGRVKHSKACSSEFDYAGWRAYSKWKRRMNRQRLHQHEEIEDDCVFPSECRWSPEARAERLREDREATLPELADIGSTPTFDSILGLPLYGERVDCPEPTVSFTIRADHPNPLLSALIQSTTSVPSELEGSGSDVVCSKQVNPESKSDHVEMALHGRKSANSTLRKPTKTTEQRSANPATPLSPIEEEDGQASTPSIDAASGKVNRPAFRLSAYLEKLMKSFDGSQGVGQHTWAEDELADNIDMQDAGAEKLYVKDHWFNEPLQRTVDLDKGSPEGSLEGEKSDGDHITGFPELDETSGNALFDSNLEQEDEIIASLRRNAWDWSPGDKFFGNIGIALSNPLNMDEQGGWIDEMDVD